MVGYQRFGGPFCKNPCSLHPEDEGSKVLRNDDALLHRYTASHPEDLDIAVKTSNVISMAMFSVLIG
jgi:hypothetical protein